VKVPECEATTSRGSIIDDTPDTENPESSSTSSQSLVDYDALTETAGSVASVEVDTNDNQQYEKEDTKAELIAGEKMKTGDINFKTNLVYISAL
jgi:hypothetical protein